jgi:hypothetical protein
LGAALAAVAKVPASAVSSTAARRRTSGASRTRLKWTAPLLVIRWRRRLLVEVLDIEVSWVFVMSGSLKTDTDRGVKRFALLGAAVRDLANVPTGTRTSAAFQAQSSIPAAR